MLPAPRVFLKLFHFIVYTEFDIKQKYLQLHFAVILQVENMNAEEMNNIMKEYNMKSPVTGNDLSEPMEFNLMFSTSIGPTGTLKGLLLNFL